jgi:hypothetical protein
MFQDIIRLTVQKIFNDKILLGLLIVCLLGFFVGGFSGHKDEPPVAVKGMPTPPSPANAAPSTPAHAAKPGASDYAKNPNVEPSLAVDFVKWWMKAAMDYSQQSAAQSHEAASNWMSPESYRSFTEAFWTADLAEQINSGATVGAFQPIAVQAEAINPDHSVVVGLTGTLVLHSANGRPNSHQVKIDVLVRKSDTGLRITGINNHVSSVSSSVY